MDAFRTVLTKDYLSSMPSWICIIRFVFVLALLVPGVSHALDIEDIRFGVHSDKTRIVIEMNEQTSYRVFQLPDPYRIVIDLPQFNWRAGITKAEPKAGISSVRYGLLQPGISRIVMDMKQPPGIANAFVLTKPDRLVIDFKPVAHTTFMANLKDVLGTLTEKTVLPPTEPISKAPPPIVNRATVIPPQKPKHIPTQTPPMQPKEKPLVVIDPGHGGVDPGAIGSGKTHEKQVVLALGHELRRQLLASGKYRVLMTRENDRFIKLGDRVRFARNHNADLFVSIHADSIGKSNVHGASVYTLSNKASDAQTAKLAARENRADLIAGLDLSHEDDDVANILVDLAMRDTMNQSRFFANSLVEEFRGHGVRTLENPHRYAGFAVLKAPDTPSVLVEAGFMSNRKEAQMLSTPAYRSKVANAIMRGIDTYFSRVEKNRN